MAGSEFEEATRALLADISTARGCPLATEGTDDPQRVSYPFNFVLTSATIPTFLSTYLATHHPTLMRLSSPRVHHLPPGVRTEYAAWTGGNRDVDVERRIRRVWAEDALASTNAGLAQLSKVILFCNKRQRVEQLGAFLESRGIRCVALTGCAERRQRGSNRHLDGFLKPPMRAGKPEESLKSELGLQVLVTTSLLSRGLDFNPDIRHVFLVDEPRNMIDFLHRAGRTGRAGQAGKVVMFGRAKGRGSNRTVEMRKKIKAVA